MRQWYVLYTKVRSEKRAATALKERNIETFLPEITEGSADQERRSVAFFPGYMFMRVDLNVENPAHWQWAPGVRYIVTYADQPVPVPDEIINLIRNRLIQHEAQSTEVASHGMKPGDTVKVKDGPFRGMLAVFDGPTTPEARVQVLLRGLSNSVRLRLSPTSLEKVDETGEATTGKRPRRTRGRGRRIN